MPAVLIAVATVKIAVVGIGVSFVRRRASGGNVGIDPDAMRPSPVGADAHATGQTPLEGKQQAVVDLRAAVVKFRHRSDKLPFSLVQQREKEALVRIGDCVAAGEYTGGTRSEER